MRKVIVPAMVVFCLIVFPALVQAQSLSLEKNAFSPGEAIKVIFNAPGSYPTNAWIGIIPSDVPHGSEATNDQYDLTYQYLNKRTSGALMFTAPAAPGNYDFRMHDTDNNGREVASVSFTVAGAGAGPAPAGGASLRLDKTTFSPGEQIAIHFTTPPGYHTSAWIGIIPSNVPHGSEATNDQHDLTYQYLQGRTGGTLMFNAPAGPGNYDFRMHDTDNNGREVSSVSFTVQ